MGIAVTADRRELERAVAMLRQVVMRETPIDLYRHVLVERRGDTLTIRGTNINSFGQVEVGIEGEPGSDGPFTLALPPAQLHAVVSNMRAERVKILAEGIGCTITGGGSRTVLRGPDPADFTDLPPVTPMKTLCVSADDLAGAIKGVCYVAIRGDQAAAQAHVVVGFEVEPAGDGHLLVLTVTDSLRMAEEVIPVLSLTEDPDRAPEHIPGIELATPEERRRTQYVLAKELQLLLPALEAAGDEPVTLAADWRLLSVQAAKWEFIVSVAEQRRLKIRDLAAGLVGAGAAGTATLERLGMVAALRAARAIVPVKGENPDPVVHDDGAAIMLMPGRDGGQDGTLVIRTGDREGQSYYEEIPARIDAPEPLFRVIAMRFLSEALAQFDSARVVLSFGQAERDPAWLEAVEPAPREGDPPPAANLRVGLALMAPRLIDENSMAKTLKAEWDASRAEQGELIAV